MIWGILNHCFRKFEVKCRYAQYKILTSEIIDLKNYFLFYVPSRLFLQRLIVPWVQCFDEFLITVFEIWRKVSLCKVQNINEWNDSSAIISSSSVKIVSAALTRTVIWGISNHCFRKFECVIRKWNCPTVIISNITMLSIQNFKEDRYIIRYYKKSLWFNYCTRWAQWRKHGSNAVQCVSFML